MNRYLYRSIDRSIHTSTGCSVAILIELDLYPTRTNLGGIRAASSDILHNRTTRVTIRTYLTHSLTTYLSPAALDIPRAYDLPRPTPGWRYSVAARIVLARTAPYHRSIPRYQPRPPTLPPSPSLTPQPSTKLHYELASLYALYKQLEQRVSLNHSLSLFLSRLLGLL